MITARPAKQLPYFTISSTDASSRIKKYLDEKYPELCKKLQRDDTRSVWYDIGYLEELIRELHYLNADGLRIYFGAYPDSSTAHAGQTCLIFVPTFFNEQRQHEDIILESEPGFDNRPVANSPMPFNYGSPCPMACLGDQVIKYPLE